MQPKDVASRGDNANATKSNYTKVLLIKVFALVVAFVFILFAFNRPSQSTLKIDIGGQIIELGIQNDEVKISVLISKLFESEVSKVQTEALLREFHKLYYIEGHNLVNIIESIDENSFLSQKLRELLGGLRGPFRRDLHSFYNIQDTEIAEAIEKLGYDHKVSVALRKLLIYRKGPFASQEKEIIITLPSGNEIKEGFAASCRQNEFYRENIRIFDSKRRKSIDVYVRNPIGCSSEQIELFNLIHLSQADMQKLLDGSPILKHQKAFGILQIE